MSHSRDYPAPAMFIDGEWTDGTGGKSEPVYNPATEEVLGHVPHASIADLDRAVAAAVRGFAAWSGMSVGERAHVLLAAMALIQDRAKEIGASWALKVACFGHAGDGNVHVNLLRETMDAAQWQDQADFHPEDRAATLFADPDALMKLLGRAAWWGPGGVGAR